MTKSENLMTKLGQKKIFLLVFLVFIVVGSGFFVEFYYPSIHLTVNQRRWEAERPSTYFMKVRQRDSNGWASWKVIVSDEVILKGAKEAQTVDQIFSRLESECSSRGFIDCGITFNSQFHYPTMAHSYEMFYVEIEQFIPCDDDVEECFSAMESE
jgi:hypothetical protein